MIAIDKIILENFQSHKYSKMEFVEGLNAIIGSTDSGKTAIFRAIKWALYNEPQGDYFVREGEEYVSVKIFFNSGAIVNRYRRKGKNGYELTSPDGTVSVFEGFGTKIPEEVLEATKIRKVNFTPSENRSLNMAEQLDQPFLISETPGLKAAAIGKLVEADVVDYALSETNRDLQNKRKDLKSSKEKLESIKENLKDYEYLDKLKSIIEKLEDIEKSKKQKEIALQNFEKHRENYSKIIDNKSYYEKQLSELNPFEKIEKNYLKLGIQYSGLRNLNRIHTELLNNKIKYQNFSNINKKLSVVDRAIELMPIIENKNSLTSKLINLSKRLEKINNTMNFYKTTTNKLKNLETVISKESKLSNSINVFHKLYNLSGTYKENRIKIERNRIYISKFREVERAINISNTITIKKERLELLKLKLKQLDSIKMGIVQDKKNLDLLDKSIEKNLKSYNNYLKELDICPVCFRPIDIEDEEGIMSHLKE